MYNTQAVKNAAIAQPVERILGKDEVASSNLASSSKTPDSLLESGVFLLFACSVNAGFAFPEQWYFARRRTASLQRSKGCGFAMSKKRTKMNTCGTSLKEVWECYIISKTSKCVSDATLSNYHHHLRGIGKHLDTEMSLQAHIRKEVFEKAGGIIPCRKGRMP